MNEVNNFVCNKGKIEELGIGRRTLNALTRAGYYLVEELVKCSDKELLNLRNIGKANVDEIREALGMPKLAEASLLASWPFEQQIRQSQAYDLLSRIENIIRRFISYNLRRQYGEDWWNNGIPKRIQIYVSYRIMRESQHKSAKEPVDFVDFADYKELIVWDSNWDNVFSKVLLSKEGITQHLVTINSIRRTVAHTRPIDYQSFIKLCEEAKYSEKVFRIKRINLSKI